MRGHRPIRRRSWPAIRHRRRAGAGGLRHYEVETGSHRYEFWIKPDGGRWYRYAGGKVEKQPTVRGIRSH